MLGTLISAQDLNSLLQTATALTSTGKPIMVFDCSFDLAKPEMGQKQFDENHIANAVYVNLDADLSSKNDLAAASGGRHPLPSRETFADWLGSKGFTNAHQAIVYDRNGSMYCGRLWWMLKWLGHDAVAVLDGGLQAWQDVGGVVQSSSKNNKAKKTTVSAAQFAITHSLAPLITVDVLAQNLGTQSQTIVDARGVPRFRGDVEPLDPVAGHIPGALNRPFTDNFDATGKFKSAEILQTEYRQLLAGRDPACVVHQCGSGVTAAANILAMELAGLGRQALFAGSWSEWCSDPNRPVAQG